MQLENIEWKNIYHMLCYAVDELRYFNENWIDYEEINGEHDLLAELLCSSFKLVYDNGYLYEYISKEIVTDKPYGDINIEKSIETGVLADRKLVCTVNSSDIDNRYNQLIKLAFNLLLESNNVISKKISIKLVARLKQYVMLLDDVTDIEPSREVLIGLDGATEWYRPVLSVCNLIVNDWLAWDESGEQRLLSLEDGARLRYIYQKATKNYYRQWGKYKVITETYKADDNDDDSNFLLIPDCVLVNERKKKLLIIDNKWYERSDPRSSMGKTLTYGIRAKKTKRKDYEISAVTLVASSNKSGPACVDKRTPDIDVESSLYFQKMNTDFESIKQSWNDLADKYLN